MKAVKQASHCPVEKPSPRLARHEIQVHGCLTKGKPCTSNDLLQLTQLLQSGGSRTCYTSCYDKSLMSSAVDKKKGSRSLARWYCNYRYSSQLTLNCCGLDSLSFMKVSEQLQSTQRYWLYIYISFSLILRICSQWTCMVIDGTLNCHCFHQKGLFRSIVWTKLQI